MSKENERLGFSFLKSYYEVLKRLPDDKSKVDFIIAICEKQFDGKEPDLEGLVEFAYASQKHSIDKSRKGWEDVQKRSKVVTPSVDPSEGGSVGPSVDPSEQEKEKEEVQEEEEEKPKDNDEELTQRFLEWYRSTYLELTKKQSKVRTLTKTDINNLKALKKDYSKEDFKCAMIMMLKNDWAKESGNTNPAHLLRNDNFVRYLTQYDNKKDNGIDLSSYNTPVN